MNDICFRANQLIAERANDRTNLLRDFLAKCESPVEQILAVALCHEMALGVNTHYQRLQGFLNGGMNTQGIFTVILETQKSLQPNPFSNLTYRVDFYLYLTRFWMTYFPEEGDTKDGEWGKLIVEVDGHDFHDRTKEQASRDRKRDRDFLQAGIKVMRFTGSDVYNKPYECAQEVRLQMCSQASEVLEYYLLAGKLADLIVGPGHALYRKFEP